jgi:glycoside/pentoside/hexuronide:cation symporter, GPH family
MCLHAVFYTVFNIPYTALGYEVTTDYDERTRLFAWRFYFATAAGVSVQWLYKLCLMAGETEVEGVRVISLLIAVVVLGTGILPALFTKEKEVVASQKKINLLSALQCALQNRAFLILMVSYIIIVTTMFSCGALTLYINIFYIFGGDKSAAGTLTGLAGSVMIGAAFLGMLLMKKIAELTGKKTAMLISLSTAITGTIVSWFTLIPELPYLQMVSGVILGIGVQGCWLLVSSLLGDVCDDDELRTGLRQEGLYSSVSGFVNKAAFAFTAIASGYVLKFSGYVAGADVTPEIGYRMKVIFVVMQTLGLFVGLLLMALFPISRKRAEETRRILDERKEKAGEDGRVSDHELR